MPNQTQPSQGRIDLKDLASRLKAKGGQAYWRSLDELAGTPEFREALKHEFPSLANEWNDGVSRRQLLRVMGASLALLGLNGCFYKKPQGTLVPYPQQPDEIIVGRPLYFASAMPFDGYGTGVLALSREGRPVKIEGNPDHPASLGAADIFMQASLLELYDPDRSQSTRLAGKPVVWSAYRNALAKRLEIKRKDGSGVRILTGVVTSPTLSAQLAEFVKRYPGAAWHCYDPVRRPDGGRASSIFSQPVHTIYDLSKASVIVSFAGDLLFREPGSVRYARQFADGRRVRKGHKVMNRLYAIESTMSITGSMADHRLTIKPSRIGWIAQALAEELGAGGGQGGAAVSAEQGRWVKALVDDLRSAAPGTTLIVAGESQPAWVHALVHGMNQKLGNLGKAVIYTDPVEDQSGHSLRELVNDMQGGKVDTLLILGGNPVYNAPRDIAFEEALDAMSKPTAKGEYVHFTAHLSPYYDETSYRCQWHTPKAHWLESWGDVRAFDGTTSLIQPLIAPLYDGRTEWEVMEIVLGRYDRAGVEVIKDYWHGQVGGSDFEKWWMNALQKGIVEGSAFKARGQAPSIKADLPKGEDGGAAAASGSYEVLIETDPCVWAGEFANNAWLQELPKPFSKLTWENAVLISVGTAQKLGGARGPLLDGHVVRLEHNGARIEAPVVLMPGQSDDSVTLHLGYGRRRGGNVMLDGKMPRGFDAYRFRDSRSPWLAEGAALAATGAVRALAITRSHHAMAIHPAMPEIKPTLKPEVIASPATSEMELAVSNRKIVRTATLAYYREHTDFVERIEGGKKPLLSLYPTDAWDYNHGLQWGMTIDMTACIGCNACVTACQAENNIPVVGREEVMRQREMHWLRIDSYFSGPIETPTVYHQPVPCMHCENAPCEYVCPVGATTHSDEGINEMTYNRCIGTRYCSNNCPYKVRRFNFLLFSRYDAPSLRLMHNPDVTVRSRGVMEKCTYCIQRIDNTRIAMEKRVLELQERARQSDDEVERKRLLEEAEEEGRRIVRGLKTACQQTCPTEAIVFGDIRDRQSHVAQLKEEPTNYVLFGELTTKPRTSYLARLTNPNPALEAGAAAMTRGTEAGR